MLTDFQILFTDRFTDKYATKLSLTIAPHLKRVTALPCETSISKNYRKSEASIVINDKAQGSVATRLRCGGIFYYSFARNLLLSLPVKEFENRLASGKDRSKHVSGIFSEHGVCVNSEVRMG